jgi:hypothetical protein
VRAAGRRRTRCTWSAHSRASAHLPGWTRSTSPVRTDRTDCNQCDDLDRRCSQSRFSGLSERWILAISLVLHTARGLSCVTSQMAAVS